jgi:5,10-methylenetetrahydrofolate reductase
VPGWLAVQSGDGLPVESLYLRVGREGPEADSSMGRSFREAAETRPLLFEVSPPSQRSPPKRAAEHLAEVVDLIRSLPRVDALDVPELIDENHEGRPYYRSGDTRPFAASLQERAGREAIVNKVVAHLSSTEVLQQWARDTVSLSLRNAVLVGGTSRFIPYPGPPVIEADRTCGPVFEAADGRIGNIAIPQRAGEAHRLLSKTRAGARFFTTQILFDSGPVLAMIREYDLLCRKASMPAAAVVLCCAPLIDEGDAQFIRWLGAEVPEEAERTILSGTEAEAAERSTAYALRLWEEVRRSMVQDESEVPVGVSVEEITPRHFAAAADMLRAFAREIDRAPATSDGLP